jgi:hypothetical protein
MHRQKYKRYIGTIYMVKGADNLLIIGGSGCGCGTSLSETMKKLLPKDLKIGGSKDSVFTRYDDFVIPIGLSCEPSNSKEDMYLSESKEHIGDDLFDKLFMNVHMVRENSRSTRKR